MDLPATIAAEFPTYAPADQALVRALLAAGQAHLFAGWRAGADAAAKAAFFDSVRALEANYPGGVVAYASNARELLRSSAAGENPFAGMKPEMPDLVRLAYASPEFAATEEVGLALVRDSAFVLVAGGLGEAGRREQRVHVAVAVRLCLDGVRRALLERKVRVIVRQRGDLFLLDEHDLPRRRAKVARRAQQRRRLVVRVARRHDRQRHRDGRAARRRVGLGLHREDLRDVEVEVALLRERLRGWEGMMGREEHLG